ncbi:hypothetical protein F5Y19DRAFT_96468 [Xylariaceae sp. FL1651]|nr:hypothetical protein F5Y19DRAFT_96468 [Xylariaceae sp. FL1651]
MSVPPKSSRWGSFLSQAVAGVEARLDNILAEDDGPKEPREPKEPAPTIVPATSLTPPTRSATPSKSANDRLQERLARAVASRNAASSARQSIEIASTTSSRRSSSDAPPPPLASVTQPAGQRVSLSIDETAAVLPVLSAPPDASQAPADPPSFTFAPAAIDQPSVLRSPRSSLQLEPVELNKYTLRASSPDSEAQSQIEDVAAATLYKQRIAHLEKTLEETQAQHQEELHSHVERVDALEAKLQYLAREAAQLARNNASIAPAGTPERKMAEKDDQVAQLMLEGQKLASTEQKHRSIIKKLRVQLATGEKELNEQKIWRQWAEIELGNLRRRVDELAEAEKANDDAHGLVSQLRREIQKLKAENETKDRRIADLRSQIQEESERAKSLAVKVNDHSREAMQSRIKELEDTVAALEVEKSLAADRAKLQVAEAREKADRASERVQSVELELKAEVQILESKLEALRARAEEASSGAVGDAQAKLLRQIESLQTQYSIASENWQGMEASLEARAASLEKERDEALRRESEMRRKARETASRAKRQEEELEEVRNQLPAVQRDLTFYQSQLDALKTRAEQAEAALAEAKAEFTRHQTSLKDDKGERTDSDRQNWLEDIPTATFRNLGRPESPMFTAPQRTFSGDNFLGLQNYPTRLRKTSAPSSTGEPSPSDRPSSARRPSVQPPMRSPLFPTLSGLSAATSSPVASGFDYLASPPTQMADRDDAFENLERSASPQNVLQDMVSVSTMTAGPSVQVVERMSAAIRRLESERVAAKDELARISSQRDEARGEIVTLMRELETGKAAMKRATSLEKEVAEMNERYQTTLEMLGEKSELVEELRADVDDVKAMYRDLVERTIK